MADEVTAGGRIWYCIDDDRATVWMSDLLSMIEVRPGVRSGKPCFVGTRITVYDVLEYLASGMSTDEIVGDFPELTVDHVRAARADRPGRSVTSTLRHHRSQR